ncbi:OmpP1/FadL family transporter [Vibrio ulleungensis]|uniref:Outer membrane protein transport protein n=1 Tax=Vibrio ulleungensis TaxID=2807619 RepID=A0ABS2HE38_9VIBR|nr:outer membrane protein transport protein [Vibrio ulleungensis]MBM7035860.1 outer membrane protein transport protein [Vibrio ulleungensis]
MKNNKKYLAVVIPLLISSNANASGFFLPEATYSNLGTAGAGDGVHTDSAAAMFTNPATMSGMGDRLFTGNLSVMDLEMKYSDTQDPSNPIGPNGDANAHEVMPTIGLYYVKQLSDTVHGGIALASQGGMAADYGSDWGAALALNDITLMTLQLNSSVSVQVSEKWSLGGGLQFSYASYEMNATGPSFEQGDDWAVGYNLGALYQHSERLKFGLSYRSAIEHEIDTTTLNSSVDATIGLEIPAIADISMAYSLNSDWDLLASVQWHNWSAWDTTPVSVAGGDASVIRGWEDVWHFALGTEYKLNRDWRLKAGISYETSPQDDPSKQNADLPVGEQWRYSVGASTKVNDYLIDFYYEYADLGSVEVDQSKGPSGNAGYAGYFDGRLHFIGMSVTY